MKGGLYFQCKYHQQLSIFILFVKFVALEKVPYSLHTYVCTIGTKYFLFSTLQCICIFVHKEGERLRQDCSQFSTELDETITDITSVWDELNNRSTELGHSLSHGKEDNSFKNSTKVISECVDSIDTALVEEKVPTDLTTVQKILQEHKVCKYINMYVRIRMYV